MTVSEMAEKLSLTTLSLPDPDREVEGGYAGDMPSWVMGNAEQGDTWITILNNRNVIAVAVLLDMSAVIVAEDSKLPDEVVELAKSKEVNLFTSAESVFTLSAKVAELL